MHYSETQYGNETQQAFDALWEDWESEDCCPGIDYIREMDESAIFLDRLLRRMEAVGYQGYLEDEKSARSFLEGCCKTAGVPLGSNTIKNWLKTGKVSQSEDVRKNYYMLCFALNMTVEETEDFFLHGILQKPFNFKDLYETVCYFCLKNRLPYSNVDRIISKINSLSLKASDNTIDETMNIAAEIRACRTEDALIGYWQDFSLAFGLSKHTAYHEVEELIGKCYDIALQNEVIKSRKANQLLGAIYGQDFRKTKNREVISKWSTKDLKIPDSIKRNFIQGVQLSAIEKRKASDEVLRKAIILFGFYYFYANQNPFEADDGFDGFKYEMNRRLERCGYVELYWRNPHDWLFGFCAQSLDPIDTFQSIIENLC